jgi:hypothetical protein
MLCTLDNGKCDARNSAYDIIYTIYILMALGIVSLVSLSMCRILITKNLKQLRSRVQPTATLANRRKRSSKTRSRHNENVIDRTGYRDVHRD